MQAIYENPVATCFFIFFIFAGIEGVIKVWRNKE